MSTISGVRNSTGASTGEQPLSNQFGVLAQEWYGSATTTWLGASANLMNLGTLPANAYLVDAFLDVDALDSGGTPTLTLDFGLVGSQTLFLSASTTGRAGGIARANVAGMAGLQVTAATQVQVFVHAVAQTAVAGRIRAVVTYTINPG